MIAPPLRGWSGRRSRPRRAPGGTAAACATLEIVRSRVRRLQARLGSAGARVLRRLDACRRSPTDVSSVIGCIPARKPPCAGLDRGRVVGRRARPALARRDAEPPLAPVVGDVQLTEERRVRAIVVARLVRRVVEAVHGLLPPAVARVVHAGPCPCWSAAPSRCGPRRRPCRPRSCSCAASARCARPVVVRCSSPVRLYVPVPDDGAAAPVVRAVDALRRRPAGAGRRPCSRGPRRSATGRPGPRAAWSGVVPSGPAGGSSRSNVSTA